MKDFNLTSTTSARVGEVHLGYCVIYIKELPRIGQFFKFTLFGTPFLPSWVPIALCGYPIVKREIRDSSQIPTTAPILLLYNYFRQKYLQFASCAVSLLKSIWVRVEHTPVQQLDLQKINCSSSSLQAGCE